MVEKKGGAEVTASVPPEVHSSVGLPAENLFEILIDALDAFLVVPLF
jgi:hypothetical protein